jgi:sulfite reductase alpha subunit-like flavoprotein
VELDISGTNLAFEAGDAICISCPNSPEEVDELLELLGAVEIAGVYVVPNSSGWF